MSQTDSSIQRSLSAPDPASSTRDLIAYRVTEWPPMRLVPAPRTRAWMDNTRERFANRCLPLLMANQSGWWVLNSHAIRIVWTGGWDPSCIRIVSLNGEKQVPASGHFGEGVVTFNLPYLFRTPPGYNLHVHGPSNIYKDGIQALEGIVETDWSMATFTMNWKMTRTNWPVVFEKDEPICMITPQKRGVLEEFVPKIRDVREDPETDHAFRLWSQSRDSFLKTARIPDSAASKEGWQKHYFRGIDIDGSAAPEHQSKLELAGFEDRGPATYPPMPTVAAHPEALDALIHLGAGRMAAEQVAQNIAYFAHGYFHQYPADANGRLIGALMCRALFPDHADQPSIQELSKQWDALRHAPFDGVALVCAVDAFSKACAAVSDDPRVATGRQKLWDEKLEMILAARQVKREPQ